MAITEATASSQSDAGQALQLGLRKQSAIAGLVLWIGAAVAVLHLVMNFTTMFSTQWQAALHFVGLGILCVLLYPPIRSERMAASRLWLAVDVIIGTVIAAAAIWVVASEDAIYARGVNMTGFEQILALITILGAIELTRRTTGWIIPALIVISLTYVVWWGDQIDNVFRFAGLRPETLLFRSIYGDDALFGSIARISLRYR